MKSNNMTFNELCEKCYQHNKANNIQTQYGDKHALKCFVVVSQNSFNKPFTELERTYTFTSDNKYFIARMGGNSIFADCLDGKDEGVRLDWYIGVWDFEKCWYEE